MSFFFAAILLLAGCCPVLAETYHNEISQEVADALTATEHKYTLQDSSNNIDTFVLRYTPSKATGTEQIIVGIRVYENSASIITANIENIDTSDMLKVYQTLEAVNDSISFVRFLYNGNNNTICSQVDIPYVEDADFGAMVERYTYITALVMDQNYDTLAALAK